MDAHRSAGLRGRSTGRWRRVGTATALVVAALLAVASADAWTPLAVTSDPLVRMPGTQQNDGVVLDDAAQCFNCHDAYDPDVEPGSHWAGSMMAQATRDPLFWAATTVAAQDSIWAIGRPNAADLCLRCHTPQGWAGGRSDPPNGSALVGADFDGLVCESCHKAIDPFFEDTYAGTREGNDWLGYWDETNLSSTPSGPAALATLAEDRTAAAAVDFFNGTAFYDAGHRPVSPGWTAAGGGQFLLASTADRRGPFADANATHQMLYSRAHKSRDFCGTCHDVSNPVLANLAFDGTPPGDGTTVLPSEQMSAFAYGHVERTFSEFMLSDFGLQGGAPGSGPYDPAGFVTSKPGNFIASCQDCHMPARIGAAANKKSAVVRPTESVEHPESWQPVHELMGGNVWVGWLLASAVAGSPNYDATNAALLGQGPAVLTMDLAAGVPLQPTALLRSVDAALANLEQAAAIENGSYLPGTGALSFRVRNHTAHKLPSGYPEGRRVFVNVRVYESGSVRYEVNPYDAAAATLRGLDPSYAPSSPPLGAREEHRDELVYEVASESALTGESHTFHMALATGRTKDNRVPPRGFRIAEASARLAEPVWAGQSEPDYFTAAEYAGGFDDIQLSVPTGASGVEVSLYYQTTSREFIEFLADEIGGVATTLDSPTPSGEAQAYIAQTDPFFARLRAWGTTIGQLWHHNRNVPGAAPVLMAQLIIGDITDPCDAAGSDGDPCNDFDECTTGDACVAGACTATTTTVCVPLDECHDAGICETTTGDCSNPAKPDGTLCSVGSCEAGVCVPTGTGGAGGVGGFGGFGAAGATGGSGGVGAAAGAGGSATTGGAGGFGASGATGGSGGVGAMGAGGVGAMGAGGVGPTGGSGGVGAAAGAGGSATTGGAGGFGASGATGGSGGVGPTGGSGGVGAMAGAGGVGAAGGSGGVGAMAGAGGVGASGGSGGAAGSGATAGAAGAGAVGAAPAGGSGGTTGQGGSAASGGAAAGHAPGGSPVTWTPQAEGGCGCRLADRPPTRTGYLAALLLGGLALVGRRRRRS